MDRSFKVAVVGATGLIGETLIELLEERDFPLSTLLPLASDRSLGHSVSFRGRSYPVAALAGFDFAQCELAFFCAGAAVARQYAPHAAAAGCIVIDSSGEFSGRPDVPLVVPPLNAAALSRIGTSGIVASPRGASIALLLTLAPLHAAATATRIDLATYQAVSGAGRAALEELARQSIEALSGRGVTLQDEAGAQVAFNCVPQVEAFADNGYSAEELQIAAETRRVLAAPELLAHVTAVRVPVFYGDCIALHLDTQRRLGAAEARQLLRSAPGVTVLDEPGRPGGYPTAATEAAKRDTVCVGRIREDLAPDVGLNLWIVADNTRRGASFNSLQIAQALARRAI